MIWPKLLNNDDEDDIGESDDKAGRKGTAPVLLFYFLIVDGELINDGGERERERGS